MSDDFVLLLILWCLRSGDVPVNSDMFFSAVDRCPVMLLL